MTSCMTKARDLDLRKLVLDSTKSILKKKKEISKSKTKKSL